LPSTEVPSLVRIYHGLESLWVTHIEHCYGAYSQWWLVAFGEGVGGREERERWKFCRSQYFCFSIIWCCTRSV